jgi:hypothetical protein
MGHRLSRPVLASDAVFAIMTACWSPNRPSFSDIAQTLEGIIAQESAPQSALATEPSTPVAHVSHYKALRVDHHDDTPEVQRHVASISLPFLMAEGMKRDQAWADESQLQHLETSI